VTIRFNSFQRNTGLFVDRQPGCVFRDTSVTGNLMAPSRCEPDFRYAYNGLSTAAGGQPCSGTDRVIGSSFPYLDAVDDFHLTGASAADGLVPVSAGCPATDFDGQARPRSGRCTAGADER
jgi:hypothetical protein